MVKWLFVRAPKGTNVELRTLDFVSKGALFVCVPTKTTTDLMTLDFVSGGAPFVSYARG